MSNPSRSSRLRLAVAAALALCAAGAQAASGTFTFVTGEVTLNKVNGQRVTPQRGTEVDPGDGVSTGTNGMAQLTMIDQARLSLRPNSQFRIEEYQRRSDSTEGAVLSLLRGTLRTFTGLIASTNRDKFVMKTRVATVGIRGSGNILYACSEAEKTCDAALAGSGTGEGGDVTVNHTIEGSHAVSNIVAGAPGLPAQQGGMQTLITGPGQTVLVRGAQPPRYIPTPSFISDSATNPTNAQKGAASGDAAATRDFAPGDIQQLAASQQTGAETINRALFTTTPSDATTNLAADPVGLRDIVVASNGSFLGQSTALTFEPATESLRGYAAYPATMSTAAPTMPGGTQRENHFVAIGSGSSIVLGRWEGAQLGFNGPGSAVPTSGNIHWIYAPSGYPTYLSDVLTGTATYTLAAATSPTNQSNTVGTLGSASITVNFSNRSLDLALGLTIPAAGTNAGGSWSARATSVPLALNTFFATTGDRLVVTNGSGISSATNSMLYGSVDGSLVGSGLQGAILGFGITDFTSASSLNYNSVSGVAALTGPTQSGSAPWLEGRVSDPLGYLNGSDFSRSFATTNRPDEVTFNAQNQVTAFVAPFPTLGGRATYALGSAQVVQSGADPTTGLVWGRWGGGNATVSAGGQSQALNVSSSNLHYIFSGPQQGPTTLPRTGSATYDVVGSTTPTDTAGRTGAFGSATLDANFSNLTIGTTVNVNIGGQTWNAEARNVPIYRDQYFSAATASNTPGLSTVSALGISCSPGCGQGARGSIDGFFTGRTGQGAGMQYNLNGVQGAVAFGRRGG